MAESSQAPPPPWAGDLIKQVEALTHEMRNGVTERLSRIDTRLDKIEHRLVKVELRIDKVELRLDKVEHRLNRVEQGFESLSDTVGEIHAAAVPDAK